MKRVAFLLVLAAGVLSGCRSTRAVLSDYEGRLVRGEFATAAVEPGKLADEGGTDALCWQLNAAAAERLAGDNDGAIRRFDLAEDLFIDHEGRGAVVTAGATAGALATSDSMLPYEGDGQDRIFTCLYKAIDYGVLGKPAAVRTELNRAMLHQSRWLSDHAAEVEAKSSDPARVAAATNSILSNAAFSAKLRQSSGFDMSTDGRLDLLKSDDYTNAYLLNVNEVFRRNVGDSGAKAGERVTVFVEDGLCPDRQEFRIDLPLILVPGLGRYVQYAGVALPKLRYRNAAATAYSVAAGGATYPMTEVQDVDRLVKTDFDVSFRRTLVREISRAVVKVGAQAALGVAAEHSHGSNAGLALKIAQLGVAAYSYGTTEADVRSWTALPKKVYVVDIPRPADGTLVVVCGHEHVRLNVRHGNTMVFVRKVSSAAPSVVKMFTLPQ